MSTSKIRIGHVKRVKNMNRRKLSNANDSYLAVWLADEVSPMALLFTDSQIKEASIRAKKNSEDMPKLKRWLW